MTPTVEAIATAAEVADEECIVLIGRIARTVPALTAAALDALGAIDNPQTDPLQPVRCRCRHWRS
jgi:hypothetical protein